MKKYIAEAFGTFCLVLFGTGAIVVNEWSNGALGHAGISLVFGLVVLVMINSLGTISGSHINPAVTIAFTVAKRFPVKDLLPYIISQTIGALAASMLLKTIFPANEHLGATLPKLEILPVFILEFLLSFILMIVVLNVADGGKEKGLQAGMTIGATIAMEAFVGGPLTGASMNPARSLAPAIISGHQQALWIYIAAPVAGMLLAVLFYRLLK
jgi:aquaporin NIP